MLTLWFMIENVFLGGERHVCGNGPTPPSHPSLSCSAWCVMTSNPPLLLDLSSPPDVWSECVITSGTPSGVSLEVWWGCAITFQRCGWVCNDPPEVPWRWTSWLGNFQRKKFPSLNSTQRKKFPSPNSTQDYRDKASQLRYEMGLLLHLTALSFNHPIDPN